MDDKDMDDATDSLVQCEVWSACRLIRDHWSWEKRRQRRRVAEIKQRELWRLLQATSVGLAARQATTLCGRLANGKRQSRTVMFTRTRRIRLLGPRIKRLQGKEFDHGC